MRRPSFAFGIVVILSTIRRQADRNPFWLSYLRSFPPDKIKTDRSFIRDLPSDNNAVPAGAY